MGWFDETFLQSLFDRAGANHSMWLTQKQTAVCCRNMQEKRIRNLNEYGDGETHLRYSTRWNGRDVRLEYSKLNKCGAITFSMTEQEAAEQDRKNRAEQEEYEAQRLKRRLERRPEKFYSELEELKNDLLTAKDEREWMIEERLEKRYLDCVNQSISNLEKRIAFYERIQKAAQAV